MDLDLRKVRYFVQLAELEHFGRAAERLHITQPVLSRQIRALESELGCALLERTTRSFTLTQSGRHLLRTAPDLLAASQSTVREVLAAARGNRRLVVGFAPGLSIAGAVRSFSATNPDIQVDLVRLNWFEQGEAVIDGRVDVGFLRQPFEDRGLRCLTVGEEAQVVVMPRIHPRAAARSVTEGDLAGESILDGQRRRTNTVEEKLELVKAGQGLAILPKSVAISYLSPDLIALPVSDAPRHQLCLATLGIRRQPHLRAFLQIAAQELTPARQHSRAPVPARTGSSR